MQLLVIIHNARSNDGFGQRFKGLEELRQVIQDLQPLLPLTGRILTRKKHYSGRIDELSFSGRDRLVFAITDCHRNGKSSEGAQTYGERVSLEELVDILVDI